MTRRRLLIVVLGLLLVAAAAWTVFRRPAPVALPHLGTVGDFQLTNEQGRPFSAAHLRGRVSVLDFIFTTCAGPCPFMSARMMGIQDSLRDLEGFQLVSFSVDPETDTPEVLREYGERFGARPGRWQFLTGPREEIYRVIRTQFHLTVEADTEGILHSTKFVLLDRSAGIRGYYDSEDDSAMAALQGDVRRLAAAGE